MPDSLQDFNAFSMILMQVSLQNSMQVFNAELNAGF